MGRCNYPLEADEADVRARCSAPGLQVPVTGDRPRRSDNQLPTPTGLIDVVIGRCERCGLSGRLRPVSNKEPFALEPFLIRLPPSHSIPPPPSRR